MRLQDIFGSVVDAITGRDEDPRPDGNVRPASEDPFGDPGAPLPTTYDRTRDFPTGVQPASMDPYGDPADSYMGQQVEPASRDPYGDPADTPVSPASEDPYGDPADEEEQRRPAGRGWPF